MQELLYNKQEIARRLYLQDKHTSFLGKFNKDWMYKKWRKQNKEVINEKKKLSQR